MVAVWLLTGMLFLSCGSDDKDGSEGGGKPTNEYVLLQPYGLNKIEVSNDDENATFSLSVKRQGGISTSEIGAKLNVWTEEELTTYNASPKTSYTILPASLYTLTPKDMVFASGPGEVKAEIKFNPSEVFALQKETNAEYVIPLKVESDDVKVKERESDFLLHISMEYASVKLSSSTLQRVDLKEENTLAEIATSFSYKKDSEGGSKWDFTCELAVPENAAGLVAAYNQENKTNYELLPQDSYTFGEKITYNVGDKQSAGTLTINKTTLAVKYYLLPVQLSNCSDDRVLCDNEIHYVLAGITYNNPVITDNSAPDPTVIRAQDGYFYLYATESSKRNMPVYRSLNLVNWEYVGTAFTNATRPSWEGGGALWAPEIRYINNQYVLYYSWAKLNGAAVSSTGVAVSNTPYGPFTDVGCLLNAKEFGSNSIDQFYYEENGIKYMFWGSFGGIYVTELTDDGFAVKRDEQGEPVLKEKVCGNAFEGVNIYKKNGYYYMFASIGSCCNGENSSYQVVVGRSTELLGPYVDKSGKKMLDNSWELVLEGNSRKWIGPGHNSIVVQDDEGTEWILYHSYRKMDGKFEGRFGMLDRLQWTDNGWPYVKGCTPSDSELIPVFK